MKISSSTCAKLLSRVLYPLIAAVVLAATGARAGLTLEMNLDHPPKVDNCFQNQRGLISAAVIFWSRLHLAALSWNFI